MDNQVHNSIVSFIWGIADDCLRDVYVRGKYRDVILPMTVIRRLDALLEDSKDAVLEMKKRLDAAKIDNQWTGFLQCFSLSSAGPYQPCQEADAQGRLHCLSGWFLTECAGHSG